MVMFAGPTGAGKSTLAKAWCATRPRAVHLELDEVRNLIVSGWADPQEPGPLQSREGG
jgi:adenylate kinase family enzyme